MLKIKFLGIGTQVGEMRELFAELERQHDQPMVLEVVEEPNEILRHDVRGIPSIYINGRLFMDGGMPSLDEMSKGLAQEAVNDQKQMDMDKGIKMEKILVPLDPSDTAMTALSHAVRFAKRLGAKVQPLHVGALHVTAEQPMMTQNLNSLREARMDALKQRIKAAFGEESDIPDVQYELGIPADVITDLSNDYDLIMMGSTGEHGFLDRLLGSISSSVAQRAHCPVMLVPHGMEGHLDTSKLIYACQAENVYDNVVSEIIRLGMAPKEIHFVEVLKPLAEDTPIAQEVFQEVMEHSEDQIHFHMDQLRDDSVVDGLNRYAEKHGVELVVMSTKHRNPIQNLFHSSHTKKMVLNIKRPLLVLHEE